MKLQTLPVSVLMAVLTGAVHTYLLIWARAFIGLHSPLPHWLASNGISGAASHGVVFFADFLTNMVLCIPAGYLLCLLRPRKLWIYLLAALLPGLLWQYRLVFVDAMGLVGNWRLLLPGALLATLPLPATALIIRRFAGRTPGSSFKPALHDAT